MPQTLYNKACDFNREHQVIAVGSTGSTLIVVNNNSKLLNVAGDGDSGDPWAAIAETAANHVNIRPIVTAKPMHLFFSFAHAWIGTSVTTGPKVEVFGKLPKIRGPQGDRVWPVDVDISFVQDDDPNGDMWIPLIEPDATDPHHDLGTIDAMDAGAWNLSPFRFVNLRGCTELLVMVTTIAVVAGVGSEGMIVGHLHT